MNRCFAARVLPLLLVLAVTASAAFADALPRFQTSHTYLSKYIWRGFTNSTHSVVRSNVSVGWDDFTLDVWSNYNSGHSKKIDRVDYTLDYGKRLGIYDYSLGYTYYTFPNTGARQTQEIYFGVTNRKSEWSPSLKLFYDFGEGTGAYAQFSVGHDLTESRLPARLTASVGYNSKMFWRKSGFSDLVLSLSIPVKVNRNLAVVPTLWYSKGLNADFKDNFYTGFSLAWGH